jgi:23S rRNA (adenine(2503)-C(2))-methyltransferase
MDVAKLKQTLKKLKQPDFRFKQIVRSVYTDGVSGYDEITTLPKALRGELKKTSPLLSFKVRKVFTSKDKRAHKALIEFPDGKLAETVLLRPKPTGSWSTCVSSQVGCAMGCTFCATGIMGLRRHLTAEEIADQVLFWRQYIRSKKLGSTLTNVVYMGMGEPLNNLTNVSSSLKILLDPERLALSARHVSVSTVGLVPGIEKFIDAFPQVNLALSLHAANDRLRSHLVPVNKSYPLKALAETLREVLAKTRRKVFVEYVLLAGENDKKDHAQELIRWMHRCGRPDLLHINLIVWNPTDTPHRMTPTEQARKFRDWLRERGAHVTIRKNLGTDIQGACGQLISDV